MKNEKNLIKPESFFSSLADKTRLRLLNLMRQNEVCVCFFTEVLGESQPKISRHLANLRKAGIVSSRRDGKWIHYKIRTPENGHAARVLADTLKWLESQDEMQADYQNFESVCCSLEVSLTIERAPKPETFVKANTKAIEKKELETFLL